MTNVVEYTSQDGKISDYFTTSNAKLYELNSTSNNPLAAFSTLMQSASCRYQYPP
ncbi:MAG: hypothetical protein LBP35_03375 [Candidatus Ancillula trichonymphae]|jgi:hypothetical protein|nr:hypothetical protein [Candidatus Ancillula trichonymphae]